MNPIYLIGMPYRLGADPEKHRAADCVSLSRTVLKHYGIKSQQATRNWYRRLKKKDYSRNNMSTRNIVGRGSSCIEHQHFSGGPNLGNQTPIRKRLGGNSPNPKTI